jgi:hypothetical protein
MWNLWREGLDSRAGEEALRDALAERRRCFRLLGFAQRHHGSAPVVAGPAPAAEAAG